MLRSQLSKVVKELRADKRDLPYGIDFFVENNGIVVASKEWDLGFAILDQQHASIEDFRDIFENALPSLIQQIQYKASIH